NIFDIFDDQSAANFFGAFDDGSKGFVRMVKNILRRTREVIGIVVIPVVIWAVDHHLRCANKFADFQTLKITFCDNLTDILIAVSEIEPNVRAMYTETPLVTV